MSNGIRKGLGYKDRPEHVKTEATIAFERELDRTLEGGGTMNNLQYIIKNDTRAAMHMAVELCEQGDFDSVTEAFRWLLQERDDATLGMPNATSSQEALVRSFLRKISPSRDWDYLGEHEHAMIADLVDDIAATLGGGKLTADDVRWSIESRFDFDVWVPKERWQAIADELNATLDGGRGSEAQ